MRLWRCWFLLLSERVTQQDQYQQRHYRRQCYLARSVPGLYCCCCLTHDGKRTVRFAKGHDHRSSYGLRSSFATHRWNDFFSRIVTTHSHSLCVFMRPAYMNDYWKQTDKKRRERERERHTHTHTRTRKKKKEKLLLSIMSPTLVVQTQR